MTNCFSFLALQSRKIDIINLSYISCALVNLIFEKITQNVSFEFWFWDFQPIFVLLKVTYLVIQNRAFMAFLTNFCPLKMQA